MADTTILCLAKSYKRGAFCIAGRCFDGTLAGAWIRPVTTVYGGADAVAAWQARCSDGIEAGVLDIVAVPLLRSCPYEHQTENYLLDVNCRWRRLGRVSWSTLASACDRIDDGFWEDYGSSRYGALDRVPQAQALANGGSLRLIRPASLRLTVQDEQKPSGHTARAVRATFSVAGGTYRLKVTDPWITDSCFRRDNRVYELGAAILCVSMTQLLNGCAYRLAATIITPKRCDTTQ